MDDNWLFIFLRSLFFPSLRFSFLCLLFLLMHRGFVAVVRASPRSSRIPSFQTDGMHIIDNDLNIGAAITLHNLGATKERNQ
ncbi:hypothetical protein HOY82DRAFT_565644 [Tuber indicum]|nr:hypothetical protein HOY82DRAFT_565644 [Tuber indicum]